MKKYSKPEIKIILFEVEDVITASEGGSDATPRFLKTTVNGKEGANYGAQSVSIFDN